MREKSSRTAKLETAVKEAGEKIARLNRVYSMLSKISEATVRVRDRGRLFDTVCRIAVESGLFRLVWIGVIDSEALLVRPVARYGHDDAYLDEIRISIADIPEGRGPAGSAVRMGKHFICNDIEHDERVLPWRDSALKQGYRSVAAIPLTIGEGEVIGSLNFCSGESHFFDGEEVAFLERVAKNLSFAIEFLEKNEKRRQTEEDLRLFVNLIDESSDAIFVIDPRTGRFLRANAKACSNLGYGPVELLTKGVTDIEAGLPDEASWKEHVREVRRRGHVVFEGTHKRRDGTTFPIEASVRYIEHEKKDYMVAVARDITERKQAEEEKKTLEGQLRHFHKMEAIEHLAGAIAHDFNNILTAIIGYGYLLLNKMDQDDRRRTNVEQILESADRAAQLVQSLLAFGTKQIITIMPVNLGEIVQRVERLLARLIGKDIEFRKILREEITVMADSSQIEQVLITLATNAGDAMPHGGSLTIALELSEIGDEYIKSHGYGTLGAYARISVTDTGVGMDEETRKRIFEPFFTTKEMGKGTGMGLAIAYRIIKQHQGFIEVDTEPGRGTTFTIYLPKHSPEVAERTPPVAPSAAQGGTETVLIAEDDKALRNLWSTVLEDCGYRVVQAEDGNDAVEKFMCHKDEIRLAVIDIIMPGKNGKEAYTEMKKIRPDMKVLFVSGYAEDVIHQREGYLKEGWSLFSKPISPKNLLKKMRDIRDG